jgi:hypothetical protein
MVRLVLLARLPNTSAVSKEKRSGCPFVGGIEAAGPFHSRLLGQERLHMLTCHFFWTLCPRISCSGA